MRFLADMGVADLTVAALSRLGHDVVHARELGFHSHSDAELLAYGRQEVRIVLTFDLDFGDLLSAAGEALPSVVLIRTHNQRAEAVTPRVLDVAERFGPELASGALIVVEDARLPRNKIGGALHFVHCVAANRDSKQPPPAATQLPKPPLRDLSTCHRCHSCQA